MKHPGPKSTMPAMPTRPAQTGVSLLEVLIAVVVLSFGLLGLAGLQLTSLRNNQSALERSSAVMATYSIVEAMHADRAAVTAGGFNHALGGSAPTAATFPAQSIATWLVMLQDALGPAARGSIACAAGTGACTITVEWDDSRGLGDGSNGPGGDDTQTIVTEVQL